MQISTHHTGRVFLLKLVFPLIYAGFFAVQLFINFDTALTRNSDRYQFVQLRNTPGSVVVSQKPKTNQPVRTKFRLNKRFQPASVALVPDIQYSPVIEFISVQRAEYSNPVVADPLRNHRSRRGPPMLA